MTEDTHKLQLIAWPDKQYSTIRHIPSTSVHHTHGTLRSILFPLLTFIFVCWMVCVYICIWWFLVRFGLLFFCVYFSLEDFLFPIGIRLTNDQTTWVIYIKSLGSRFDANISIVGCLRVCIYRTPNPNRNICWTERSWKLALHFKWSFWCPLNIAWRSAVEPHFV